MSLLRPFYSVLLWLAQPLLLRKLRRRARAEPGYAHAPEQRLGDYRARAAVTDGRFCLWVHAVSLGETRAAALLLAPLRARYPAIRLLLTHGTATGWEQGRTLLQAGDEQAWLPWDTPGAARSFLAHFRPQLGLLVETEVWPNLVRACADAGVPLCLVNARLSATSLRKARYLGGFAREAYAGLHAVWAQSPDDAQRLRSLGAPVQGVSGNLKFDAQPDSAQVARGRAWSVRSARPVLLFASSREGEEAMLLELLQSAQHQDWLHAVQWLIVPRHPQRFDAVATLLQAAGLRVARRSSWGEDGPQAADAQAPVPCVWLGDSLGEMALYYGMAQAVLLGGSFAPLGGQNLIEAAACACPVFMGPHTFNFAEAAALAQQAGAAFACVDLSDALAHALALLGAGSALEAARSRARDWSQAHRGAAQATVDALRPLLPAEF